MQNITDTIQTHIQTALKELGVVSSLQIHLEHPANPQHGDWSSNIAMVLFGQKLVPATFTQPRQFAEAISTQIHHQLRTQSEALNDSKVVLFEKVDVAGPGFINFTLSNNFFIDQLENLTQNHQKLIEHTGQNKPIVIEYSSPNIAKPFTIGHLRSTIIGDAIANLCEATGWQVFRDNHLGDWGTQFGKQIYAIKTWGNEAEIDQSTQPVKDLVELYIKFHQEVEGHPELEDEGRKWFKRLEDGDPEARRLWQKCIEWSLKEFRRIYQELGVHFTENNGQGYGESFFEQHMTKIIAELKEKKLLSDSQGAQVVFFPEEKYPPLMIVKKDGATLYATRDLATDKFRLEKYGQQVKVVNEVGIEQALYFKQLYELEYLLGWYKPGQRVHVGHGHFRFKDQKMSTRKGNVIWLEDVLNEATKRARELSQQKHAKDSTGQDESKVIGIGALKWNDLKRDAALDVVFDWDEMLSLQGNSGPYLQYTYARCKSVLSKAAEHDFQIDQLSLDSHYQLNEEEKTVFRLLGRFNETIQMATVEFAPHHLCTYLFELAQSFNTFYNKHSILGKESGAEESTLHVRIAMTMMVSVILQQGLQLLGIQVLEKM